MSCVYLTTTKEKRKIANENSKNKPIFKGIDCYRFSFTSLSSGLSQSLFEQYAPACVYGQLALTSYVRSSQVGLYTQIPRFKRVFHSNVFTTVFNASLLC